MWGLWQQDVALNQLMESGYTMCWAAKWYHEDTVAFESLHTTDKRRMLNRIHNYLDEADVVVHYNGKSFDIPTLNREFIENDMLPPSPYREVDLLSTVKSRFRFPSNKLEYVVKALKVGQKVKNSGHELWVRCMRGDAAAWKEMEEYNKQDVRLLHNLYEKLRPWVRNHPNIGNYVMEEDRAEIRCPSCGSHHMQSRGTYRTTVSLYDRYQCQSCGTWARGYKQITKEKIPLRGTI